MGFCNNEYILISVSYSYYEVYTNTQRAFSGLGFTYGSDEDAAFITTWLEVFGLDGIKLLKLKIEELDSTFNASIDPSKINDDFDCKNKSFLVIGPGLIDYLVSKIDKRDNFKLTLKNCSDPIFLIPLLYKYAKKNIYSQFLLDQKIDVQITNEGIVFPEAYRLRALAIKDKANELAQSGKYADVTSLIGDAATFIDT